MVLEHSKIAGETLNERTTRLETLLGEWPDNEDIVARFIDWIGNEFQSAAWANGIEQSVCRGKD